jgi:shikimate 5-dehydrogenase
MIMDIVYQPIDTRFLQKANAQGCIIIPGYEMYIEQALLQLKAWFQLTEPQLLSLYEVVKKFFLNH